MKRVMKEGLVRRMLPLVAVASVLLAITKLDWWPLALGAALAVPIGLVIAFVLGRRVRRADFVRDPSGAPIRVELEVRVRTLAIALGASVVLGVAVGRVERHFGIELGEYGTVIVVATVLFALGLSLHPKQRRGGHGRGGIG
jgi:hypothetical protein